MTAKPTTASASTTDQLADVEALITGIAMLKDPFRSNLLDDLDNARNYLAQKSLGEGAATLDDFLSVLHSVPQAQLSFKERAQLDDEVTKLNSSLGM